MPDPEPRCAYSRCASPAFVGSEARTAAHPEGRGHAEVPGLGPMHFGCWWRWVRERTGAASEPVPPAA